MLKPDKATNSLNRILIRNIEPAAKGMLFQAAAQALSNATHNATRKQQATDITVQTATSFSVSLLQLSGAKAIL